MNGSGATGWLLREKALGANGSRISLELTSSVTSPVELAGSSSPSDGVSTQVGRLTQLQHLLFFGESVSDAGLAHLRGLTKLKPRPLRHSGHRRRAGAFTGADRTLVPRTLRHPGYRRRAGKTGGLTELNNLGLAGTRVTDAGLAHLRGLTELTSSTSNGTQVTDAGLVHLKGLAYLFDIDLGKTQVSDAGLVHLKGLTELRYLELSDTQVTDAGLVQLKGLKKLSILYLGDTQVTDAGVKELERALPSLQIDR